MSVNAIDNFVIIFPDPEWLAPDASLNPVRAPTNWSYSLNIEDNLQTLSTNDADPSGTIRGLLYVPDLPPDDPCYNLSQSYIPENATRQANLPDEDFNLVGLAPWINANCSQSFLDAGMFDPIRALLFYLPDNSTSQPPPISSAVWSLNDGGQWKASHHFPVYAIPGSIGAQLMTKLSQYSGNLTQVPFGRDLSELGFDSRDYARMYTEIAVGGSSTLPGLWVFLLVVVGALAIILATTSFFMHVVQRKRRNSLRRRIQSGEVNLEALGIKRLTVPKEIIEKMPLFIYTCDAEETPNLSSQDKSVAVKQEQIQDDKSRSAVSITAHEYSPQSQPTCPICLDDFESGTTTIRELPCGHIFHPDCIDNFLSNNSSLCPMCKKSALPLGYCPEKISNGMVRRERAIRRLRPRVIVDDESPERRHRFNFWPFSASHVRPRVFSSHHPDTPISTTPDVELGTQQGVILEENANASRLQRQQIAHERAVELLQVAIPLDETDNAGEQQRSKWQRALHRVFPGF